MMNTNTIIAVSVDVGEHDMAEERKKGLNSFQTGRQGSKSEKDKEKTQPELIAAYDKYQASKSEADKASYQELLFRHISKISLKVAGTYTKNSHLVEDYASIATLVCFKTWEKFDPRRAMVSTFFGTKMHGAVLREVFKETPVTPHYAEVLGKLNAYAKEHGYENCYDPHLDEVQLSMAVSEPLKTVVQAMELGRTFVDSLTVIEEDEGKQPSTYNSSPERMVLEKEEKELLARMLDSLSDYERFLIEKHALEEPEPVPDEVDEETGKRIKKPVRKGGMSIAEITKLLKKPEILERLGLKKAPSSSTVSQDLQRALRKCLHYPELKVRFGHRYASAKVKAEQPAYMQASFDEIESAIFSDEDMQEF